MRNSPKAPGIKEPPERFFVNVHFFDPAVEFVIILFTLRTTYDFTNLWEQDIHPSYRLAVIILFHIKCLDLFWIINDDHGLFVLGL